MSSSDQFSSYLKLLSLKEAIIVAFRLFPTLFEPKFAARASRRTKFTVYEPENKNNNKDNDSKLAHFVRKKLGKAF